MATRKILTKKIVSTEAASQKEEKSVSPKKEFKEQKSARESSEEEKKVESIRPKKVCQFCAGKTEPHYFDASSLRRYVNDRGRIVSKMRSGACSKHQRRISKEVKRARHLALLPFTVRI